MHRPARTSCSTEENDPHGEHGFGSFDLVGQKVFWKIDYDTGRCSKAPKIQATRKGHCVSSG
ncbi:MULTISPECIES: DUF3768 domain-containing protein [Bradyrhizobium]|uniref:DUF3768 domain-containing protein n=1 Tax=Bradyrhizobium TaxID=374 RepID=UPI00211F4727|nr:MULTISPECIES: DUF3768 domain-containing protein [Bradyrhizobium]